MTPGGVRFARYAYPPNALGYCGPADHLALFEYGTQGVYDGGLRALARDFDGAWPYLDLIARSNRLDPLDEAVVESYWIGNGLLNRVDISVFGNSMEERFRNRAGVSWDAVLTAVTAGAKPHHGFHVFCVYPWVGLMRTGATSQPLRVLDQCRIRWGTVAKVEGDTAVVESRPLVLDGDRLCLGEKRPETVVWATGGHGFTAPLVPGDEVALHWGWVCEGLSPAATRTLERETSFVIGLANRVLGRPRTGVFA
jgi:hypothetical protein